MTDSGWGYNSEIELLSCLCDALGSIPGAILNGGCEIRFIRFGVLIPICML